MDRKVKKTIKTASIRFVNTNNEKPEVTPFSIHDSKRVVSNFILTDNKKSVERKSRVKYEPPIIPHFKFVIENESETLSQVDSDIGNFDIVDGLINDKNEIFKKKSKQTLSNEEIAQSMLYCNLKLDKFFKITKKLTEFACDTPSVLTQTELTKKDRSDNEDLTSEYTKIERTKKREDKKTQKMLETVKQILNIVEDLLKQDNIKEARIL